MFDPGTSAAAGTDGPGIWDSGTVPNAVADWFNTSGGTNPQVWSNSTADTAVFGVGGTAGTVTVDAGGVSVGTIQFNQVTGSYALTGGPINLGGAATINLTNGASGSLTPIVNSVITGSAGLLVQGGNFQNTSQGLSVLTLGGLNTYTGVTNISGGVAVSVSSLPTDGVTSNNLGLSSGLVLNANAGPAYRITASGLTNPNAGAELIYTGSSTTTSASLGLTLSGTGKGQDTINVSNASTVLTFAGPVTSVGTTSSLSKQGPGTLVFTAATNTFNAAVVNGGTMTLGAPGVTQTDNIVSGADLVVGGFGLAPAGASTSAPNVATLNILSGTTVNTSGGKVGLGSGNGAPNQLLVANIAGTVITNGLSSGNTVTAAGTNTTAVFNIIGGNVTAVNLGLSQTAQTTTYLNLSSGFLTIRGPGNGTPNFGTNAAGGPLYVNLSNTGVLTTDGTALFDTVASSTQFVVFNQSGGQYSANGASGITFGLGTATYNLSGGTLTANAVGSVANSPVTNVFLLNGGTLQARQTNASFLNVPVVMVGAGGGTIDSQAFNIATAQNISSGVAGPGTDGGLTKIGTGLLTLSGSNSFTGKTTITAGQIDAFTRASLPGGGTPATVSVANGAGLILGVGGTGQYATTDVDAINSRAAFAGPTASVGIDTGLDTAGLTYATNITPTFVSGVNTLGFIKAGANVLTLTGANTYNGPTNVAGGTLTAGTAQAFGFSPSANVAVAAGATLNLNNFNASFGSLAGAGNTSVGSATLTVGNDNTTSTYSGTITGATGNLVKIGSGVQRLTGVTTFTGTTTVNAGALNLSSGGTSGALSGPVTINAGATVYATVADAVGTNLSTSVTTMTVNTGGTFNITVAPTSATDLNNGNEGKVTNYVLNGGTIVGSNLGVGVPARLNFNGGYGITSTASSTTSTVAAGVQLRAAGVTINTASGSTASGIDLQITGPITELNTGTGGGSIIKSGPGTLALFDNFALNGTYTGGTTIAGGTIRISEQAGGETGTFNFLGTGTTTILSGGTLAGNGQTGGPVVVAGVITGGPTTGDFSGSQPFGTLTTTGQSWNSSGSYVVNLGASGTSDKLLMSTLTINVSSGTPAFTVNPVGTGNSRNGSSYVIAVDSNSTGGADPFGPAIAAGLLTLSANTVQPTDGSQFQLSSQPDGGGYDLVLTDVAAPEPTSLLLLGLISAPVALGRRRVDRQRRASRQASHA